jgi:hypothetical protein
MTTLKDLVSMLITGAYANTTFSGTNGELKEAHYEKISNLINLGVIELYKRFKFLENELILHVTPSVTTYYLRADKAVALLDISTSKYIELSTSDGFLNITKVTGAFDSSGEEIPINFKPTCALEYYDLPVIISLATDILKITNVTTDQTISIVYQSYPTKLILDNFDDPESIEISIPDVAIEALLAFIAAKTFKPMGDNNSTANADKSASYEQQYELACQKISLYGLPVQDTTERDTFVDKGWV